MEITKFIVNSDYVAEKQVYDFIATLDIETTTVQPRSSVTKSKDIQTPPGNYFETVSFTSTLTGDKSYPSSLVRYEVSSAGSDIGLGFFVYQVSNGTYRLAVRLFNDDWNSAHTMSAFSVTARVHLSIAPSW